MIRRDSLRDYLLGAMWVLPSTFALVALVLGSALSLVHVPRNSMLAPLLFQGTADDARSLLIGITGTMITVIALLLGLTVVALQLASTQFSPRLLRNFLRDRPNQVVLSVFVGTFAYSAAGLYTVGVSAGSRTSEYPRLAVTGAIVLLFLSLCMLVYFADHLAHSIQIDAIMRVVERNTLLAIEHRLPGGGGRTPAVPEWAVPVPCRRSGYLQAVHAEMLLPSTRTHDVSMRLRARVGEHVVAGTDLAWIWRPSPEDPAPDPRPFAAALERAVHIGFERTFEQDAALGIRQLVDVASKALSPAVNDPYTAVQAVDHLSVIFCALARRPLGDVILHDGEGRVAVVVPARRFGDYLSVMCGHIRRYGSRDPIVVLALLRLLDSCARVTDRPSRWETIGRQAELVATDAEREIAQPADLLGVHEAADALRHSLSTRLARPAGAAEPAAGPAEPVTRRRSP